MNRAQLKSMGVAAPGYGNALFLDEGDDPQADAVVFDPLQGTSTVYATDAAAEPVEESRRSFSTESEALDHMYQALRDKVSARQATLDERREEADAVEAQRHHPEQILRRSFHVFEGWRELGPVGILTTIVSLLTAVGWVLVSPFTYTREDALMLYAGQDERGSYIFDAESWLPVVAVIYGLAVLHMAWQWRWGRRALRAAGGTALFASVALVCMLIRSSEIEPWLYWLPPLLALLSAVTVVISVISRKRAA
ncbi:hypothetical protein BJ980_002233 [Nocardioides daedukensis]|uniref:Uncharacterized protein n=1 Tax=Nocardioides daedukensis TaxID=634462 RepID=A0A7Y9UVW4_9ACTN|nr:hypothetical protein [Nocardioides daedukensis]NYG59310.1 hypothetical protein [Nocardioides daedukensis]